MEQDYLGVDKTYYEPTDRGYEAEIAKRLEEWKRRKREKGVGDDGGGVEAAVAAS